VDFGEMEVKARAAVGNIVTKYTLKPTNSVTLKEKGASTLEGEDYWFDESVHRLNKEGRGTLLGNFSGEDKILTITSKGVYKLYTFDLLNHFDEDIILIQKHYANEPVTLVYYDGKSKDYFSKRFEPEITNAKVALVTEHEDSRVELATTNVNPVIEVEFYKEKGKLPKPQTINMVEFSPMINLKAKGRKLSDHKIREINLKEPEEIKEARKFLKKNADEEKTGLSPVELHRRAMEKLNKKGGKDFFDDDGQITFDF
jgi:topoisomerase-4 subunit A